MVNHNHRKLQFDEIGSWLHKVAKLYISLSQGRPINNEGRELIDVYLQFFRRFATNIEAIGYLMPPFATTHELKLSINLLLRSICSDVINMLYLTSLIKERYEDFLAELNVISLEYLKSAKSISELELKFVDLFEIKDPNSFSFEEYVATEFPHLLNTDGKLLTKNYIRKQHSFYQSEVVKKDNGPFTSETLKFDRITEAGMEGAIWFMLSFKYYSLYQHYTPEGNKLANLFLGHDEFYLYITLDQLLKISQGICLSYFPTENEISVHLGQLRTELTQIQEKYADTL